jgi:acetyltransferase-like isoleucine patch superfamily enzyme
MSSSGLADSALVSAVLHVGNLVPRVGHSVLWRGSGNRVITTGALLRRTHVRISGDHNRFIAAPRARLTGVRVVIRGAGNTLRVDRGARLKQGSILWIEGSDCEIRIGEGTTIESATLAATETRTRIDIGRDCMLATDVDIRTGDSHAIFDRRTLQRVNPAADVEIGDHVWLGHGAQVLKGVRLPPGSVVGAASVVTRAIDEENVVVAGVPARVVRRDVQWTRSRTTELPAEVLLTGHVR